MKSFLEIIHISLIEIIISVVIIFVFIRHANATTCYVTTELTQAGHRNVACVEGFVPANSLGRTPNDPDTDQQIRTSRILVDAFRPIINSPTFADCDDPTDCGLLAPSVICPFGGSGVFASKDSLLPLTVPGDPLKLWVIWCEKKEGFAFDRALKDTLLADRLADKVVEDSAVSDQAAKDATRPGRLNALKACDGTLKGAPNLAQVTACLRLVVKEVSREVLDASDL